MQRKLVLTLFVVAVGFSTKHLTCGDTKKSHSDTNHDEKSNVGRTLLHQNVTDCPRPHVGTCKCSVSARFYKTTCSGLDVMPELNSTLKLIALTIGAGSITQVPVDYFRNFDSLFTLKINNNKISTMFRLPKNVRNVDLNGNLLNGSVLYEMLNGFTKIRTIDVGNNPITDNLKPGIFTGMKDLNQLLLCRCQMSEIPLGLFDGLHNLAELRLGFNKYKQGLHKDTFKNMKSTIGMFLELNIQDSGLEVLEEGTFQNMSFVNDLNLNGNKLTTFPDLKGIADSLNCLDLSFNNIADIDRIKQSGIKHILQLNLENNQISTILPDHFKDIRIYEFVSLSNNRIKKIPAGIFNRSIEMNQLILQNNKIETIEKGSFDGMTNLKEVFLFNNKLTSLPDDLFVGISLRNLFLNGNKFNKLIGRPFRGMKTMKTTLYLFSNTIGHIEDDFFSGLGNETTVALRCRNLKDLPHIDKNTLGKIFCTPYNLPRIERLNNNVATSLSKSGFNCVQLHQNDFVCTICQAGTYGNGKKGSGCSNCSAGGFYQDEMGQTQCKNCSIGTFAHPDYAPAQTPLDCMACPKGTRSNENAGFRACKCLQDFYRTDRFGSCMSCPKKGLKCINDYAILTKGYYWVWTNHSSKQIYSDFIYNLNIESDEFVKGTWRYTGTLPKPHKCPHDSCLGGLNSTCKAGYRGLLCAICEPSYFERMGRCIHCPSKLRAGFEIAGVVVAFVLILLALLWGDKKRILSGRTWADVILSCFKIIIGFYQVMAGLYSCLSNIEWPSSIIWMQKALHLIELNVLQFAPLSCLSSYLSFNALQQFVVVIVSNTVVVGIILIYLAIRIRQHKNKKTAIDIAESVAQTKSSCIRNICVFLFATYPKTCTSIFQILSVNCIPLCSHDKQKNCPMYLRSDVSVQCQSPLYDIYSKVALGFLIYPVGFPVVMVLLVWYYVHKPSKSERKTSEVDIPSVAEEQRSKVAFRFSAVDAKSPFQSGLSLFYENYRPECWYWESVEMARKLLLTSGLTLIGAHSRTQIGLGAIISALFSIFYALFHPISNPFENHLQTVALMAVFLNLGIGVMFNVSDDVIPAAVNQHNDKIGVSMIMIAINSAVVVIVIVKCLKIIIKSLLKWCKTADKKCSCSQCCKIFRTFCLSLLTPLKLTNSDYRQKENYHQRSSLIT